MESKNTENNKNKENEKNVVDEKKYEKLVARNERMKRKNNKILWEYHPELVSTGKEEENEQVKEEQKEEDNTKKKDKKKNKKKNKKNEPNKNINKLFYTEKDKELIKQLLYNPIPDKYRAEYWFIVTGAKMEYLNNRGYYQKLLNLLEKYNNKFSFIKTISLDMHRTFPNKPFFKDENNLNRLSNILKAFALRNCASIGYCQGFNYIAAQLLLVFNDEEKTFWTYTKIIEDYLPFNFYLKFTGVRIDMEIVHSILVKNLDYIDKNEELRLCLNNLVSRCFISLYSEIVEEDILRNIWDAFFIYGDIILFRTFKYIGFVLCNEKFKKYNIESVHEELTNKLHKIKDYDLLNYFLIYEKQINYSFINESRKRKLKKIDEQNSKFKETMADTDIKCDVNSPFCFYNLLDDISPYSKYKIFKLKKNTKKIDNYFKDKFNKNENNLIKEENLVIDEIDDDDVLIERMEHVCVQVKDVKNE